MYIVQAVSERMMETERNRDSKASVGTRLYWRMRYRSEDLKL